MAHPTWPLYDVVIRTPRLELRLPTEDEYVDLLQYADETIYERTGIFPFVSDWVGKPSESMQYLWRARADWKPDRWHFTLCTFVDGEIVGTQAIEAANFGVVRSVATGSWLVAHAQGKGLGTEMRTAVLHFAFAGLGALEAHSEAHVDNAASNAVSRALGYEFTHREAGSFRGERHDQWKMILRRADWAQHPAHQRDDITIEGLEPVLDWFVTPEREAEAG